MQDQSLLSLRDLISETTAYLPALAAGLAVLALGWLVAWVASKLVVRLLILLRLDRVVQRAGWGRGLAKGDVRHTLFGLVGRLLGAGIFLVFLDNALVLWRLTVLSRLVDQLVFAIPQLLVSALTILVGWAVAAAASRAVRHALYQERFAQAGLVARIVSAAILVLAVTIALVNLGVAGRIVSNAFLIAFGALALSFVLAFGLGSRRAVELMWEQMLGQPREAAEDDPPATAATPPRPRSSPREEEDTA